MFIFFVFILFIAISIFYLAQRKYTKATLFMLLMGFSYLIVVSCIIIYMAKDAYYYNKLYDYFGISKSLQNKLMFLPLSRLVLIRIFNVFTLLFLYTGVCAALFFSFSLQNKRRGSLLLSLLAVPPVLQLILYDPVVYTQLYYKLYPSYMSSQAFLKLYDSIHTVTLCMNIGYITAGSALLLYAWIDAPKVRQIRSTIVMIIISYLSVQVTYLYMNYWAPDILVKVSKAAHFVRYKPINLVGTPSIYNMLPYIAGICLLISLYSIYKYARIQNSIKNQEAVISHNIDSALLTSRVFSHYMKNELLAIMAQTEFIEYMSEGSPQLVEEIKVIEQRCRNVYERLDAIHQKNLKSKIELKPLLLNELLEQLLQEMKVELKGVQLQYNKLPKQVYVMADGYYLTQALQNLLANAVDALEFVPEKQKQIAIEVHVKNKWVELVVRDNGKGMSREQMSQIFQPFYSSKPTATNWGMGLSITHTIIINHGGKIHVDSQLGEGSAFHIVLPLLSLMELKEDVGWNNKKTLKY